jgi:hypothetical protein
MVKLKIEATPIRADTRQMAETISCADWAEMPKWSPIILNVAPDLRSSMPIPPLMLPSSASDLTIQQLSI